MGIKITTLAPIVLILAFISLIGCIFAQQTPESQEGEGKSWTREDYANHFINERMVEITQTEEKFKEALKDEILQKALHLWFKKKNRFISRNYYWGIILVHRFQYNISYLIQFVSPLEYHRFFV